MAAVLTPAPSYTPSPAPRRRPPARPALRVLEGGRSPAAMAPVYRRRRLVAALALVTAVVVLVLLAQAGAGVAARWSAPAAAPIDGPTVAVTAEPGDTLWTVARRVHPTGDVRPRVEAMLADRGTTEVQVGDVVRVPAG